MKKKAIIALSGGLDSLGAALILKKKADYDISAVFMRLDSLGQGEEKRVKEISNRLGLRLEIIDLRKEFQEKVINYFLEEYKKGRTPNPCIVCNKEIKFGLLLEKTLKELKGDFLVTGHYVRSEKGDKIKLFRAKDKEKDQSYFLWQLNQKQLKRVLFPLGNYLKKEIRLMVKRAGFNVSRMPESQELCFVKKDYRLFLKERIEPEPGDIIDDKGKIVGQHQGLYFYTIGQRRKFDLSSKTKEPTTKPYYVIAKDLDNNRLIVTQEREKLFGKEAVIKELKWLSGQKPELPLSVMAKIRSQAPLAEAHLSCLRKGQYKVIFKKPQLSFSPGQSLVFYSSWEELLGGGIII